MKRTDESDREPERADLDAWRAEAGAALEVANAATPGPWADKAGYNNTGCPTRFLAVPGANDGSEVEMLAGDSLFAVAARTGWPRDAARVGVLCAEVERLQALPSQLRAAFQDPAGDWPTSDRDKLRRIAALLGIEIEEPT